MKLLLLILSLTVSSGAVAQSTVNEGQTIAQSGCCNEWDYRNRRWRIIGYDLERCKDENDRRDRRESRNDVYQERGDIWWDVAC